MTHPDVELESFLIVITAPLWFAAFVLLALAGAFNNLRGAR